MAVIKSVLFVAAAAVMIMVLLACAGASIRAGSAGACLGVTLEKAVDYAFSTGQAKEVGPATLTVKGYGGFIGQLTAEFQIVKGTNPVTATGKTATVKYSVLKKNDQTLSRDKVLTVQNAKGSVSYKKTSGNKKITINKSTGKVTVKKGLKKGTYDINVKVTAAGTSNYRQGTVSATFRVKIK